MPAVPAPRSSGGARGGDAAGLLGVLALVAIAFSPALRGGFLEDDLARPARGDALPLEQALLAITQQLAQPRPVAFHLVSLTVHLCATSALFLLARCLTRSTLPALVAAALFGLHPVHAECVARISEMRAPLAALFVLLALFVFAGADPHGAFRWRRYALSIVLFLCGLLADLNAIVFLPAAILIDLCTPRAGDRRVRMTRCAIHGGLLLAWLVLGPTTDGMVRLAAAHPGRTVMRVESIGRAVEQLCWPFGSNIAHSFRPSIPWSDPTLVIGLAGLAALIGTSVWLYHSQRNLALLAALVIPAALLQPLFVDNAAGAFPIAAADLYLPAAGLALLVAQVATTKAAITVAAVIAIAFGAETYTRTQIWRSDLVFLRAAVAEHPESPRLQWRLGQAQLREYTERGDWEQLTSAGRTFQSALDLLARAQKGDGSIYATTGDFVQSNLGLGWSLLFQSEHDPYGVDDTAHRVFEMVAKRYPESAEAHMAVGVAALAMGRFEESGRAFDQALALQPDYPEALHNLGQLHVRQRDWPRAIDAFERALRSRPHHLDDLVSLARALAESGHEPRAIQIADLAAALAPGSPLPLVVRGTIEARRGAFEAALAWADRALAVAPDDGEALLLRGKILLARGEPFSARTAFTRAADRLPQSFEAHYNLAALQLRENHRTEALPHLVVAYALRPPDSSSDDLRRSIADIGIQSPDTYWRLASIDAGRELPEIAEDWLGRALELDAQHGPSHMLRGLLRKKRGDRNGAVAELEHACRSMPESYPAHYALGTVLVDAGRKKDGLVYLERALELATKSEGRNAESAGAVEGLRREIDEIRSRTD